MSLGMTRDEYWHGDIFAPLDYVEADRHRLEAANRLAHLQGAYIFDAIGAALVNAFAKEGSSPTPYREKPFELNGCKKSDGEDEEERQNELDQVKARMENMVMLGKNMINKE